MRVCFEPYIIDVDLDKTRQAYAKEERLFEGCPCNECLNFEKAIIHVFDSIKNVFSQLGIDMSKPAEAYEMYSKNGQVQYGGFYHLCGSIVIRRSPFKLWRKNQLSWVCVDHSFQFAFVEDCSLLSDNFQLPCIQMEICISLPWVLEGIPCEEI